MNLLNPPSLSSLIDVVFLLLAYFVLTAAFALPERSLTPAISVDGQGADDSAEVEPQIVQVRTQRGQLVYQLGAQTHSTLESLRLALRQLPQDPGLVIKAEAGTPFGAGAAAIQAGRDVGFQDITFGRQMETNLDWGLAGWLVVGDAGCIGLCVRRAGGIGRN